MRLLILTQKIDKNDPILGFFHRWIEEFSKYYERVTVICLEKGQFGLPQNVKVLSLGKEDLKIENWKLKIKFRYILNFYQYIWQERKNYDAVFVHMNPIYVVLGGLLWRMWKKKVALWYTHKHVDIKLRLAEKFANIIFTASSASFRLHSKKVLVMGHGIDIERFKAGKNEAREIMRVVTVGRISPVKDYETLIEAAFILVQEKFPVEVHIVGDVTMSKEEEYLARLKELVHNKKLDDVVTFVGSVAHKNLLEHLQKADAFVNMSNTGSLDKAVLEAMACGIPVVTSNEAFKDVLGKDREVLMFKKGDVLNFAKRIKAVYALSNAEKQEMAKQLRNVILEKHNLEKLIRTIAYKYETSR